MCKHPNCGCGEGCADANNPQVTDRERRLELIVKEFIVSVALHDLRGDLKLMSLIRKAERELAR